MSVRPLRVGSFLVLLILGGLVPALQARVNGELSGHVGTGIEAALISFGTGFVLLTIGLVISRPMREGLRRIPVAVREGRLAWWAIPAGLLGGLFVACQSFAVPLIGVAMFTVGVVAGQSANALLVDRLGLSPVGRTPLTPRRLLAALIAISAVVIAVSHLLGADGFSPIAMILALIAGAGVAIQQALGGRVNNGSGNPLSTAWLNFAFGTSGLVLGTLVGALFFGTRVSSPEPGPWWMYLGGVLGVAFITTASWAVPRYGVLVFALVSIAGQLLGALLLDLLVPVGSGLVAWNLIVGVLLTFVAVAVGTGARLQRPRP
jgi:bacterial/archaeal transporter family-2 protein